MTAAELIALAERVEALTGPCRETDRAIRDALGLPNDYSADWGARGREVPAAYPYTASLDEAMSLVPRGWIVSLCRDFNSEGEYWARATLIDSFTVGRGRDPEEKVSVESHIGEKRDSDDPTPRVLTAAALRARAAQVQP